MTDMKFIIFESKTVPVFTLIIGTQGSPAYAGYNGKLVEIKMRGFGGTSEEYTATYEVYPGQEVRLVVKQEAHGTFGNISIEKMDEIDRIDLSKYTIQMLPEIRVPEYLLCSDDGNLMIYVSADKYMYSYKSFRFFISDITKTVLRGIPITNVERFRDGGTTNITLDNGMQLHVPAPFNKNKCPQINGMELSRRGPDDYIINEESSDWCTVLQRDVVVE